MHRTHIVFVYWKVQVIFGVTMRSDMAATMWEQVVLEADKISRAEKH